MPRKIIIFFTGISFFLSYGPAEASLIINEILYSPTSKQWVEIYNDGDLSVDLTKYKILDSGASVNGHGITAAAGGSNFIEPHSFVVVAKVPEDFGSVSFQLFKSALGIKTTGDNVILRDTTGAEPDDTVAVLSGSAIDGKSLQLVNGSWVSSAPTPGAENEFSTTNEEDASEEGAEEDDSSQSPDSTSPTSTSSSGSSKKSVKPKVSKSKVTITAPKVAFVGIPFELKGEAFDKDGNQSSSGKYFWNFGDGNSKDRRDAKSFLYTYPYEGDYVVSLEYYSKSSSKNPDFDVKVTVKIVPMNVSISEVGDQSDFFIELSNNTSYEMDISGWALSSLDKKFVLPNNSSILPKKKIILSSKTVNFNLLDEKDLKLSDEVGKLVFDYGALSIESNIATIIQSQPEPKIETQPQPKLSKTNPKESATVAIKEKLVDEEPLPIEDLSASVVSSGVVKEDTNKSYIPLIIFVIFIGSAAGAVYYIRRKNVLPKGDVQEDFTILDE